MFVIYDIVGGYVDVCVLCCYWGLCWSLWFMLIIVVVGKEVFFVVELISVDL